MIFDHAGAHDADHLVIALGADYDMDSIPGLSEAGNEFHSGAGAERLAEVMTVKPLTPEQRHERDHHLAGGAHDVLSGERRSGRYPG